MWEQIKCWFLGECPTKYDIRQDKRIGAMDERIDQADRERHAWEEARRTGNFYRDILVGADEPPRRTEGGPK
jgi:hypothetical protein